MNKVSKTPHDRMFRDCFSAPKRAWLLLSEHLPKGLVKLFNPGALFPANGVFTDGPAGELCSDLLFRLELKAA